MLQFIGILYLFKLVASKLNIVQLQWFVNSGVVHENTNNSK